ncbi:PAS domain-containing protein [Nannocystis sp.]|uniref:PAS domain-containing protein n=1 Tax=Nannocystis sp. TaxID=1962667 RepID=UPI0025CCE945|nr:PAS domain-containing protein [Nannocystis sp.]MBK7828012.1 PAS domain-containing protein [Nannocystis sp.]
MADYDRFFQVSLEMLATANRDGYFVDLNPVWARVLGYSLAELRARPFVDFVHAEDREATAAAAAKLFQGAELVGFENRYRHQGGEYRWLSWTAAAAGPDGLLYACARDITPYKEALAEREQALVLSSQFEADYRRVEEELRQRVEAQQDAIHSMSTPIIQVWDDIVTMPVVGLVDSMRAADMKNSLLETVARTGAKFAIVDLTGVDTVDTATADHLLKVMRAVGLLGARCVITGIQPSVAQIIVALGLDMHGVITLRSLREGLKYCMRAMGLRVTRVEGGAATSVSAAALPGSG